MKALVFKNVGEIAFEEVPEPTIQHPKDAIVRITATTICGTDLHMVRGTIGNMLPGTVLGHEGVGVVEQVGAEVKDIKKDDRVIIPSTIGCGYCPYCKRGLFSQCDNANPHHVMTAFYGGPGLSGPFNGLQAEYARVPFADTNLVKLPDEVSDEQAILLSDILPTAYQAVDYIEPQPSDRVAVFGCGPVGQLIIASLKIRGIKEIYAIDFIPERLKAAEAQGAYVINFDEKDPVRELKTITKGNGPEKVIDAVGIDADHPHCCGATFITLSQAQKDRYVQEVHEVAPQRNPHAGNWNPGSAPSQVSEWAIASIAKAGIFSIIGVYNERMWIFPVGYAMGKNLTVRAGNCNHRAYFPLLLDLTKNGTFVSPFGLEKLPFKDIVHAYERFDKREFIKAFFSLS